MKITPTHWALIGAAGLAAFWLWRNRAKSPAPAPAFAPLPAPQSFAGATVPKKKEKVKKGKSPKKGPTVDIAVESEEQQMTEVITIIGQCELEDGSAGTLILDAYGDEQCVSQ